MKLIEDFGYCEYDFEEDYVHIYNLFIYPKFRKQGNARKLLQSAIKSIQNTGYKDKIKIVAIPKDNSIPTDNLINVYKSLNLDVYTYYG
jgi:ribosomal protein S18 acetylase RimI-like enzyme